MKDIVELSALLKSKISLLLLLPFCYLAIYISNKPLYDNSDLILKVVICLCLSFVAEFILSFNIFKLLKNSGFEEEKMKDLVDVSVIVLLLWLSFLIFVSYSLDYYTSYYIPFYNLILLFYSLPFFALLLQILYTTVVIKNK